MTFVTGCFVSSKSIRVQIRALLLLLPVCPFGNDKQAFYLLLLLVDPYPIGPGPWICVLIGSVQPYMVGGPPSHCATKERWGSAAQITRFT